MQTLVDTILSHFVTPFWSVPVGLTLCTLVGLFCLAAFWWGPTGGQFFPREGIRPTSSRAVNAMLALSVPIAITVGVFLIVFPVQPPVGVYLKSQSHPDSFNADARSAWDDSVADWLRDLEDIGMGAIDAGLYAEDVLGNLAERTPQDGWQRDSVEVSDTISELVLQSLATDIEDLGNAAGKLAPGSHWHERLPRWLIESVEIAVIKGLVMSSNVQALSIEAHPRRTPSGHAWVGIMRYFSSDLGNFAWVQNESEARLFGAERSMPASWIKDDATALGSDEVPQIVGQPRFLRHENGPGPTNLTVAFKIAWPAGSSSITVLPIVNGTLFQTDPISKDVAVPTDTVESVVVRSSTSEIDELTLRVETGRLVTNVQGLEFSVPETARISIRGDYSGAVAETVRQVQTCNSLELANWRFIMNQQVSIADIVLASSSPDVEVLVDAVEGIWFIPEGLPLRQLDEIRSLLAPIPPDEFGTSHFMKASRSRTISPGPYSFHNTPFNYDGNQLYFSTDDGQERAFIVDHDPQVALNSGPVRIHTARPLITEWRLAREDRPGFVNLVHMAVNPETQGLLLNASCAPANPGNYDNGRFLPFWRAFYEAINSAAISQLSADSIEARERLSEPLFALNESAQARLRSERTRPGLVLVLLGILLLLYSATRGVAAARRVTRGD